MVHNIRAHLDSSWLLDSQIARIAKNVSFQLHSNSDLVMVTCYLQASILQWIVSKDKTINLSFIKEPSLSWFRYSNLLMQQHKTPSAHHPTARLPSLAVYGIPSVQGCWSLSSKLTMALTQITWGTVTPWVILSF